METMIEDSFMRTGWRERLPCFALATVCALAVILCRTTSASVILVGDFVDTAFVTQGYKEDIRLYKELGGGAMYDLGCYCTTMILSLIESDVESVKAVAEFTDKGVDALTTGFVKFKNGARASFNVGMILGENTNSRFDRLFIHGSSGSITSDVEYNQSGLLSYKIFGEKGVIERKIECPHNYTLGIEQLSRCVKSLEKPYVSREFSLKNASLMDSVFSAIGY